MDKFGAVAVVFGGYSHERDVSLRTGKAVVEALKRQNVNVTAFEVSQFSPAMIDQLRHFDRVFIALHGAGGEDGLLQGLLECIDVPYTGSGVLASALAWDKLKTKEIWKAYNIPSPQYWYFDHDRSGFEQDKLDLYATVAETPDLFPLVVKPVCDGSSLHLYKVRDKSELEHAFASMSQDHIARFLVEKCIQGQEYTIGIVADEVLPIIRIVPASGNYDYSAKYERNDTGYQIPSGLTVDFERDFQALAFNAYKALRCTGWARLDLLVDAHNQPYFLELNTVPGLTKTSLLPKAAEANGVGFDQLVLNILETSLNKRPSMNASQARLDEAIG